MTDTQNEIDEEPTADHPTTTPTEVPDAYDEVSTEDGMAVISNGDRIMEFGVEQGHTFSVYEGIRGDYIGRLLADDEESFYEIDPKAITEETPLVPGDGDAGAVEAATMPLVNNGWEITYYDAENADRRMHDMLRE